VTRCPHGGTAVEGEPGAFCCHGCELAAAIIRGAGLERYYAEREAFAPRPEPAAGGWERVPVEPQAGGTVCARLQVDGLRCASCVWVTEQVLARTPGVTEATVSYATGRATLRWDPSRTDLPTLAGRIAALGYRPRALGEAAPADHDLAVRAALAVFAALAHGHLRGALRRGGSATWTPLRGAVPLVSLVLATPVTLWRAPRRSSPAPGPGSGIACSHGSAGRARDRGALRAWGLRHVRRARAILDSLDAGGAAAVGRCSSRAPARRAAEASVGAGGDDPSHRRAPRATVCHGGPVDALAPGDRIDVGAGEEFAPTAS
jgi:copper chaperone CopZ